MKIKIFIVTYRHPIALNNNLKSLFESDLMNYKWEINIINNHSNFALNKEFEGKVNILHNVLRPDFSTGHLSRNWNQALINGFKDLNNPDCDILVACQDDVIFKKDCFLKLIKFHKKYSFIQSGVGDSMMSFLPDAVKKIGVFDERYCNIGSQESDYFLRALIYNKEKSMISDVLPGHNMILNNEDLEIKNYENDLNSQFRIETSFIFVPALDDIKNRDNISNPLALQLFMEKWDIKPGQWNKNLINYPPFHSRIKNFIFYPYFEKDVEDLAGKNYFAVRDASLGDKMRRWIKKRVRKIRNIFY